MRIICLLVFSTVVLPVLAKTGSLSGLKISPAQFDAAKGEQADISFLSQRQGQAIVRLYGPDWQQVRELVVDDIEPHRQVKLRWDGRDDEGQIVPYEAYFPVVEFADHEGGIATLDPTFESRIGPVRLENLRFDRESGMIRYALVSPARITLHAGIAHGGPLLRTLISDEPRFAGEHQEPWNGKDEAGFVDILAQEHFRLFADGVGMWDPSVIVTGGQSSYSDYRRNADERPIKEGPLIRDVGGTRISLPRPHDITPEPRFTLTVSGASVTSDGLPLVSGKVRLQVALDEKVRIPVNERRFEIVLFSDLEFVSEVEEGHSPATIIWESTEVPDGDRLLTVNVATLPGQMSSASLLVRVANTPK